MFTGIISELGVVEAAERGEDGARLRIRAGLAAGLHEGDSVAVSGACLTAASLGDGWFEADAINQTLSLTTLGDLAVGDVVNLEGALLAGSPLGGHMVQGHVDGVGAVVGVEPDGFSRRVWIEPPADLVRFVAARGSITVDGISLTVSAVDGARFEVSLIPETLERTTLGAVAVGERVNLEIDVVARYAERLLTNVELGGSPDG
jgi:riboflavin synthase